MMLLRMFEINNPRSSEINRTLDTMNFEQTLDYNPSQVVFDHVQNFDAVVRDRKRSVSSHTSSYNGLIQFLRLIHDHFGIVAIDNDNLKVYM